MEILKISPVNIDDRNQEFFKKNGFIVIRCINFSTFLKRFFSLWVWAWTLFLPYIVISFILSIFIHIFIGNIEKIFQYFLFWGILIYWAFLMATILLYIRWKYLFLSSNWALAFFKWYPKWNYQYLDWYHLYNLEISKIYDNFKYQFPRTAKFIIWTLIMGWLSLFGILTLLLHAGPQFITISVYIIIGLLGIQLFLALTILILDTIFSYIYPLITFGDIWEKIQKITPRIEEQSKRIQSEFQRDLNFSVLSNGFDSLSATFSEIVTLVIKLEKVETRANKWNLFDSEKYINSLRSDIVTPLISLKTFLEKQKSELMNSKKELNRVRVWGNEGTENMELQSKRSESLIQELTENIEKLDVMIGKMG